MNNPVSKHSDVSIGQQQYYGGLFEKHGATVEAVASAKQVYKDLRYEKLSNLFEGDDAFSVHDVGFGLGHYYEYLRVNKPNLSFTYSGSEVTPQFVAHCLRAHPGLEFYHRDLALQAYPDRYDYIVFGGTFYHIAGCTIEQFEGFIFSILKNTFSMATKGIAFNLITDFVEYKAPDLYYGNVDRFTRFVNGSLSRYFRIDHAYPLYELTFCVYQEQFIRERYPGVAFRKYYK